MNLKRLTAPLIGILLYGCLDPYAPPQVSGSSNYLVVSGFLNAGDNSCTITLTRSLSLASTTTPPTVSDAKVTIEDAAGNSLTLVPQGNGVYSNLNLSLNLQKTYRLHVKVTSEDYLSDYVPINPSPSIDSVGWMLNQQESTVPNVTLYVNSHGTTGQMPYYLWDYEETWSYTAAYASNLKFENGNVVSVTDTTFYCWKTLPSTSILIGSTIQLSQNAVHQFTLASIPINSVKFFRGYSILVKQLALTKDAFEYWQQLKSTTENLGTIFGPQPTRVTGNIHSSGNPTEPVFGYFSAAVASEKRIFIRPSQLPPPPAKVITGYENCQLDTLTVSQLAYYAGGKAFVSSYGVGPVGYTTTSIDCVDCRFKGGTNVKPIFWYE